MDEWENGLPDEYEQEEEISEQGRRDLAAERQEALELELEQDEQREQAVPEPPSKKKLKRELEQEALARLESAARTVPEWNNVIAWWDRLDANRERRERYHEISRNGDDLPIDYGADENGLCFPDTMNTVLEKQRQKGDFIDTIFNCPYQTAKAPGHVLPCDSECLAGGGEAEDLVLDESHGQLYIPPVCVFHDDGGLVHIIQDIGDIGESRFVGSEQLLGVEGQIQTAKQIREFFTALEYPKELHQIAVIIIDDFSLRRFLSQKHFGASHARLDVSLVRRHESLNCRVYTALVAGPRQCAF